MKRSALGEAPVKTTSASILPLLEPLNKDATRIINPKTQPITTTTTTSTTAPVATTTIITTAIPTASVLTFFERGLQLIDKEKKVYTNAQGMQWQRPAVNKLLQIILCVFFCSLRTIKIVQNDAREKLPAIYNMGIKLEQKKVDVALDGTRLAYIDYADTIQTLLLEMMPVATEQIWNDEKSVIEQLEQMLLEFLALVQRMCRQ